MLIMSDLRTLALANCVPKATSIDEVLLNSGQTVGFKVRNFDLTKVVEKHILLNSGPENPKGTIWRSRRLC